MAKRKDKIQVRIKDSRDIKTPITRFGFLWSVTKDGLVATVSREDSETLLRTNKVEIAE